ncbi:TlyA family RNA methyltransferase [Candidatus Saccharibacteria bacterium]|nr:TlyA family RNA methyltransferase [Candidatus Saccharibacteria bacterium]
MMQSKQRLDVELVQRGLVQSRSQAENYVKLGVVYVNKKVIQKAGTPVTETDVIDVQTAGQYVSRAGLKLASVAEKLHVNFQNKTVLDVGSSTGGFTDYALQHGAKKVLAVDVGTDQLHPSLRNDKRIELHEKTDIRDFFPSDPVDIVVIDVSFISLREILPHIAKIAPRGAEIVAMLKPQFEAGRGQTNKGVIKNNTVRRKIIADFESWAEQYFIIQSKRDSEIAGQKGNVERFYLLKVK